MDTISDPNTKKNPTVVQVPEFPIAQYAPLSSFGASSGCNARKIEFTINEMFSMKMYR